MLSRLRRATGIETTLFESVTAEPSKDNRDHSRLSLVWGVDLPEHNQLLSLEPARQSEAAANEHILAGKRDIGRRFLRLASTHRIKAVLSRGSRLH